MLKGTLIAVTAIAVTTGAANAMPFLGTDTFTDTTAGSPLSLTATYDLNPISFDIGPGLSFSTPDLLTIISSDASGGSFSGSTAVNNIQVTFDFSKPDAGTGSASGIGSETVVNVFGSVFSGGFVVWKNPSAITFPDGTLLDVALGNTGGFFDTGGASGRATISADFTLVGDPRSDPVSVPEPGSVALLGTGLLGLALLARQAGKN